MFADPKNPDVVYILNTGSYRSIDGGKTFNSIHTPHGDNHGFWIDPNNPRRLINGNDGGATISTDGGASWTTLYNQPTAQFYHIAADNRFPYRLYGAQQDNSTVAIATASASGGIDQSDFHEVGGGESGYVAPDPKHREIVYAGSYGGDITRYDHHTEQTQAVNPWPRNVKDRRISGNGERMVGAVQRYQRPQAGRTPGQGQGRPGVNPGDGGGTPAGGPPGTTVPTATLPF